jgi:hypothetical protein
MYLSGNGRGIEVPQSPVIEDQIRSLERRAHNERQRTDRPRHLHRHVRHAGGEPAAAGTHDADVQGAAYSHRAAIEHVRSM